MRKAAMHMRQKDVEGRIPGLEALARTFIMSVSNYARDKCMEEIMGSEDLRG